MTDAHGGGHVSAVWPVVLLYLLLIIYASLYPFEGWRDQGLVPWAYLWAPWPQYWTWFDLWTNVVGYVPFGALLALAFARSAPARSPWLVLLAAWLSGTLVSACMEALQSYIPTRIPSNVDLGLNSLGTFVGAIAGLVVHRAGLLGSWDRFREHWLSGHPAWALALALSWPLALLYPEPVPLGVGHVASQLEALVAQALQDTPFDGWFGFPEPSVEQLSDGHEFLAVGLGLLGPLLLVFTLVPRGPRRVVVALVAAAASYGATWLSAALTFGPEHAASWIDTPALMGWLAALIVALPCALLGPRAAAVLCIPVVMMHVGLVNRIAGDPYFTLTLQTWEQGRFIRFHGVTQWLSWLWPYAALLYCVSLAMRGPQDERRRPST